MRLELRVKIPAENQGMVAGAFVQECRRDAV